MAWAHCRSPAIEPSLFEATATAAPSTQTDTLTLQARHTVEPNRSAATSSGEDRRRGVECVDRIIDATGMQAGAVLQELTH